MCLGRVPEGKKIASSQSQPTEGLGNSSQLTTVGFIRDVYNQALIGMIRYQWCAFTVLAYTSKNASDAVITILICCFQPNSLLIVKIPFLVVGKQKAHHAALAKVNS